MTKMSDARDAIREVRLRLADAFAELDDSEEAPLGELPKVVLPDEQWATLYVYHETEPWRLKISLSIEDMELTAGEVV